MDAFLQFFESLSTVEKVIWVAISISFNLLIETFFPLSKKEYRRWKHAGFNFILIIPVFIINTLFGLATVQIYRLVEGQSWILFELVSMPVWLELVLAIAIFDLVGQYTMHYLLHKVKWMWKMHMVHHSDTYVDASSALRLHPGDYLVREIGALIVIGLTGAPFAYYMVYRIGTIFFTYFTHANVSLPVWLDKSLSYLFVTPNMHKFHHHFERPWTDTNYGNMLSIWDRIFGTFVYDDPEKIKYGLDVLEDETADDMMYQLKLPWNKDVKTDY